jgi:hypothetical protein
MRDIQVWSKLLSAFTAVSIIGAVGVNIADAQTLKGRGEKPWLGCCEHCSKVMCSGCSETTPLEAGGCNHIANCTTKNDVNTCKPAPDSQTKRYKKSR